MIYSVYPLLVCVASSLLLALLARRRAPGTFGAAAARGLEWIGLAALFLLGNVALGMAGVLGLRELTGTFVSLYLNVDVTLAVLSALQAAVAQWWWSGNKNGVPPEPP